MAEVYITSDSHYAHSNCCRGISTWKSGFRDFDTLEQMNNAIVDNINDRVSENDTLYHLGDWSFGGVENVEIFRKRIICKNIHLIYGNHDENIMKDTGLQSLFSSTDHVFTGYIGKTFFHLSHYAHRVWPKSHKGSIHLYGHSHGSIPDFSKSMDVGVDCHPEFRPFHINEVIQKMSKIEIVKVDHHGDL